MKTACNELIERLVNLSNATYFNGKKSDCDIIDKIKDIVNNEFVSKEKQQIIHAVTHGNRMDFYDATETAGEQYYTSTFETSKETLK